MKTDIFNSNRPLGKLVHKVKRVLDYTRALVLYYLTKPVAFFARKLSAKNRGVWLVSERGNDARDNGYWFFRWLREEHPELRAYYVIDSDAADYGKVSGLGETVRMGSLKHYYLYNLADNLVGTHVQPAAPDSMIFYRLGGKGILAHGKQIFLQHGVIKDNMEWMHYPKLRVDIFVCGAKKEFEYIDSVYGHPKGVAQYLGLCRFDHLLTASAPKKQILVMPTWRGYYYPKGNEFLGTDFYKYFQSFLSDPRLLAMLKELDYQLIFYPHIELQSELGAFKSEGERIILADSAHYDVQQLLMDCEVLITDYSSVYFDVGFLRKPVLYYQFDEEEFRKIHYSQGYFVYDRDGFGPVCRDEESLMSELLKLADRGFKIDEEYLQKETDCFPLHDANNRERTYDAILALKK